MQLPAATSSPQARVRYGRYLARRLRRANFMQLATDMTTVTNVVRQQSREWDDTDDAMQEALADRDGADDDLDTTAKTARAALAGRDTNASTQPPYTLIFPYGIDYYTAAPLDEEVKRYGELSVRLTEHLPAGDDVRVKAVPEITAGITDFDLGAKAVDAARTEESLASTRLAKATDAWEKQVEKTYGALVTELGRAGADRFFPQVGKKVKKGKGAKGEPSPK